MSGGFGTGWGGIPWGGAFLPVAAIPVVDPCFNLVYLTTGGTTTDELLGYVQHGTFTADADGNLVASSGGDTFPSNAVLVFATPVPASWTFQVQVNAYDMPNQLGSLRESHLYFGVADHTGVVAGIFVSKSGIAYSGAIAWDGVDQDLALNGPFQVIPGTAGMFDVDTDYTFRLAYDSVTDATYVFGTATDLLVRRISSHRLLAILPGLPTKALMADGIVISVRGTDASPTKAVFSQVGLGTGLCLPNIPPQANAGADQTARTCGIIQLDGTSSFDPEAGVFLYRWRLIDVPVGSSYAVEAVDGHTLLTAPLMVGRFSSRAAPPALTDRWYSSQLHDETLADPVVPGDVLVVAGAPYSISGVGTDVHGYYVAVDSNTFAYGLSNVPFKVIRQRYLSNPNSDKPTLYPDVAGLFKFDLTVYDGEYISAPVVTVANVLTSATPQGILPDLSFIWQHLSDFWKLVEDRERIQVLWESMAQVAAAEMLNLWQVDYNKSLRDIQRTFQRKWLHYDLKLPEPLPDLTAVRRVYGGVSSLYIGDDGGIADMQGTSLVLESTSHSPIRVQFYLPGPYRAWDVRDTLLPKLRAIDSRYNVRLVVDGYGATAVLILAPFYFVIGADTDAPCFQAGVANVQPTGSVGTRITPRVYRVDRSLEGLDIQTGDLLVVDGEGYLISRVVSDPSDWLPYQRVVVQSDLPITMGIDWAISSNATSRLLNFYDGLVTAGDVAVFEISNEGASNFSLVQAPVTAACADEVSKLGVDLAGIDAYVSMPSVITRLAYVLRRTRLPIGDLVVDVPCLQENVREIDGAAVLRRNLDFFIEAHRGHNALRFSSGRPGDVGDVWEGGLPAPRLWAEVTYFDNRPTVEANFGGPAEFKLDQLAEMQTDLDYLSAVRGLWYAYLHGPTMRNLRVGTQILLGLPFAEEQGTITEIRASDYSPKTGRILVQDDRDKAVVRSYTFPKKVALETSPITGTSYVVGDSVAQFAPLTRGVEVIDYVGTPDWFQGILHQGRLVEVEKYHSFLVRVDSSVFQLQSLMFARAFVFRIKPTYTYPLFIVRIKLKDTEVDVTDKRVAKGRLILHDGARCTPLNYATMLDQYRAAGGGVRNQLDSNSIPTDPPPVFPTPDVNIEWGLDKGYLSPEEYITASWRIEHPGGVVQLDQGFSLDNTNYPAHFFSAADVTAVPPEGFAFPGSSTVGVAGTLTSAKLTVQGSLGTGAGDYLLVVLVNGLGQSVPFTVPTGGMVGTIDLSAVVSLPVLAGDVVELLIAPASGGARSPNWVYVAITLKQEALAFQLDTGLPAGTYSVTKVL